MSQSVPNITFKTRVRDENIEGPNPFRWQDVNSDEIFAGKKVVVFALTRLPLLAKIPMQKFEDEMLLSTRLRPTTRMP